MTRGMRIPSLPFAPSDFARYPTHALLDDGSAKVPSPALIAELHDAIRTGTLEQVQHALDGAAMASHIVNIGLLFMAIEPATGNSPLHTAMDAQRLDVLEALAEFRTHSIMAYAKPLYAAFTHQRQNGDSILHSAVRSGKLELVTAALDLFPYQAISALDETVSLSDEAVAEAGLDGRLDPDDGAMSMGELVFVLKLNGDGRTAAEEARVLGHEGLAEWLDRAAACLDAAIMWPDSPGARYDASILQLWREGLEQYYGLPYELNG